MIKIKLNLDLDKQFSKILSSEKTKKIKSIISALKAATPIDTGNARDNWRRDNDVIRNDVEYINRLNAGSSQQAPAHFIETTLLAQKGVKPNGTIVRS